MFPSPGVGPPARGPGSVPVPSRGSRCHPAHECVHGDALCPRVAVSGTHTLAHLAEQGGRAASGESLAGELTRQAMPTCVSSAQPHCCHGEEYHTESSRGSDLSDIMEEDEEELCSEMQLEDGGRRRPSGTSHGALKVSDGDTGSLRHPVPLLGLQRLLRGSCPDPGSSRIRSASFSPLSLHPGIPCPLVTPRPPKAWVEFRGASWGHPAGTQ